MKRILPLAAIGLAFAIGAASPAMAGKYEHERGGYGYNAPAYGGGYGHNKGYGYGRDRRHGYDNRGSYGRPRYGHGRGQGYYRHRQGHGGYRPTRNYYGGYHSFGTMLFRLYGN